MFGLSKPNIDKMMRKKDVDGLIRLLSYKDVDLRKKAAEALASLIMKAKPETLNDVEMMLGSDATKLLDFRQEGDRVYVTPKDSRSTKNRKWSSIIRRVKDLGGLYFFNRKKFLGSWIIPLYKPPLAPTPACECSKPIYLDPEKKERAAEELGKFGDDLAVGPLLEYASSSPLTAIQSLSNIGSARAIEALRTMLFNGYREHPVIVGIYVHSQDYSSDPELWMEIKKISVLEEAIIHHRDYEGCKEIIRVYLEKEIKEYKPIDEMMRALIFRVIKQIMGKPEARNDKELLMIFLKCLGAFPADFSGKWQNEYLKARRRRPPEEFKEYLLNLDLEILGNEEVLNHIATLIPEYPNTLESNPIATALQRVESEKKNPFLKKYLKSCEDAFRYHAQMGWVYRDTTKSTLERIIDSLRYWLSFWKDS